MNLQELIDQNRAEAFPMATSDSTSFPKGTLAQPVAGPPVNQLSAITAALQALQTSMTTMLSQPAGPDSDIDVKAVSSEIRAVDT